MEQILFGVLPHLPLIGLILVTVAAELIWPERAPRRDGLVWVHVGVLYTIAQLLLRLLPALTLYGVALWRETYMPGLPGLYDLPLLVGLVLGLLLLDFGEYLAHRLEHEIPFLWRLHRTHHSDEIIDTSTALRFHPLEVVFRAFVVLGLVVLTGVPEQAILLYAYLLLVFDIWQHANLRMPQSFGPLRKVIITPDLHCVHHSDAPEHHGCNFGVVFSIWDRLLGTYGNPAQKLSFGLGPETAEDHRTLYGLLRDPFKL